MKFCMQCGAEISEGVNFCRSCGAKVGPFENIGTFKAPDSEGEFDLGSWTEPDTRDTAVRHEEQSKIVKAKKKAKPQNKEKKQGCLSYILLFGKVLFIAVGSVFLIVFLMELFSDDKPDTPKTEQHQPVKSESDTTVFPQAEEVERSDDGESVEDRIYFLESLLQRSEVQLEEELAKGDEADMKSVTEIRDGIARIREELRNLKQQK